VTLPAPSGQLSLHSTMLGRALAEANANGHSACAHDLQPGRNTRVVRRYVRGLTATPSSNDRWSASRLQSVETASETNQGP
jgi:hypothetical protein